jgi:hypothetical protein
MLVWMVSMSVKSRELLDHATMEEVVMDDDYYIEVAIAYLGLAIRDNSRSEKIEIGKAIDNGTWEEE